MAEVKNPFTLDRYTTMGDLTKLVRDMMARSRFSIGFILGAAAMYLGFTGNSGAAAFTMIAAASFVSLVVWSNKGIGLPIVPMITLQHLVTYGLPIFTEFITLGRYTPANITAAGLNVMAFLIALTVAWRMGMEMLRPSSSVAYVLVGIDREGVKGLTRLGLSLVVASTALLVLQDLGLVDLIYQLLPSGSLPIFWAVVSATSACGFFLMAMIISSREAGTAIRAAFWALLALNCVISASGFLLSAAATTVGAVVIGFWWGTGKPPLRFTLILLAVLSFLNLGKFTMRARYWHNDTDDTQQVQPTGFLALPTIYAEWSIASFEHLRNSEADALAATPEERPEAQTLLDRVNNLQNLLYVIEAMDSGVPALHGATYTLIPSLLVPRILWPDKPRTHAGQILLNTHFGRQTLASTFQTYIAWGLLPEAYGNFGPIAGAIILGLAVGFLCAWAENFTSRKPILSAEGFVAFVVFMGLANSYEMVASVLVTSIFQAIVPVAAACTPFVRRKALSRREDSTSIS